MHHQQLVWLYSNPQKVCNSPSPHVAPAKLVCEQSQTYLFHPSVQEPPCMQGRPWHWPGILWHEERMEPEKIKQYKMDSSFSLQIREIVITAGGSRASYFRPSSIFSIA